MTLLVVATLLSLIGVPVLLMAWLLRRSESLVIWGVKAGAVTAATLALFDLGNWSMLSVYGRYGLLLVVTAALVGGVRRMRRTPVWRRPEGWGWVRFGAAVLLLGAAGAALWEVRGAQEVPPAPVELAFPMDRPPLYVASGGSRPLMNPHMKVGAPAFSAWRGQLWALDLVALYPWGGRARGLYPTQLDRFAIFGAPVYAPCAGSVVRVEGALPDLTPPARDTTNKAGNYVMVKCGPSAYVVLAHLQQGSVAVASGDSVAVGTRLGAVGNSGNSWEPHLHLHAQRGPGTATPLDADPRPMTFGGRFLVRNDVVEAGGTGR